MLKCDPAQWRYRGATGRVGHGNVHGRGVTTDQAVTPRATLLIGHSRTSVAMASAFRMSVGIVRAMPRRSV